MQMISSNFQLDRMFS